MFLLIALIVSKEHIYKSKGHYSFTAYADDTLSFSLQNDERVFIFSSLNQNECFVFPNINHSIIPTDFKALSFDNSEFQIKITCNVNITIWIIEKLYCHPNSIFVMASYEYSLDIKINVDTNEYLQEENSFNYCIFSPSIIKEYRKVSFDQQKSVSSSNFLKCSIFSSNVDTPDYQTEGQYIESVLSYSFFLKISISSNNMVSGYQTIQMNFTDDNIDNSFVPPNSPSFFSTLYYYEGDHFVKNENWIGDIKFSYNSRRSKKFSWILIVIILFIMIILLLLCIFIIYVVIKKRNASSVNSIQEEENDECIPDAQSLNQNPAEPADDNDFERGLNEDIQKEKKKQTFKSNDSDKPEVDHEDNPYLVNLIENPTNSDSSDSIDPNVIEINPYSLPKA